MNDTIIKNFDLRNNQNEYLQQQDVDFVNLELGVDNAFFLDFNNILKSNNPYSNEMKVILEAFSFQIGSMLLTDKKSLKSFLSNLHETNSTYIGWSDGKPDGNSIGPILCDSLINALSDYKNIFTSGKFNFNTLQFTVKQIGSDRVSDIITSVCKNILIKFTIDECNKYSIPRTRSTVVKVYNHITNEWGNEILLLPSFNDEAVILLPKDFVTNGSNYKYSLNKLMTLGLNNLANIYSEFVIMKKEESKSKLTKKAMKKYFYQKGYDDKDIVRVVFEDLPTELIDKIILEVNSYSYSLEDAEIENIISRKAHSVA